MTKLMYLARLRPGIYNILDIDLRKEVEDMPLTIDKEKDPLYRMGVEEGLQEGIEIALKLKFGKQGIEFYEKYIKKEKALKRLKELLNKIEDAKDIKDLM